jgi:hypothetical protein
MTAARIFAQCASLDETVHVSPLASARVTQFSLYNQASRLDKTNLSLVHPRAAC